MQELAGQNLFGVVWGTGILKHRSTLILHPKVRNHSHKGFLVCYTKKAPDLSFSGTYVRKTSFIWLVQQSQCITAT